LVVGASGLGAGRRLFANPFEQKGCGAEGQCNAVVFCGKSRTVIASPMSLQNEAKNGGSPVASPVT
jgi:hypothetical protein